MNTIRPKLAVLFATIFLFALSTSHHAHALSIDLSALSNTNARQVVASVDHIQKYERSEFEISAQYAKTQGSGNIYDIGMDNQYRLGYGLRSESDYRFFQDRSTFSSAIGVGIGFFTLSGGFRQDIPNEGDRQTFGKVGVTARFKLFPIGISARCEALAANKGESRLDYRVAGKVQFNRFYVAVKAEQQKGIEMQSLGLGVSF